MGCHTWFYKRLEVQPSYEEVKNSVLKDYKNIFLQMGMLSDLDEKNLRILNRQQRMIIKDLCKEAVCRRYVSDSILDSVTYIREKGFYKSDNSLPHDLFRVPDYPEDMLFSLHDTLTFIKNNDTKVTTTLSEIELLKQLTKFWTQNPEALIYFG